MKQITLSIKERLELPSVLPERGGFVQQEIVSLIKEKIRLSPEEIEELKIQDLPDGRIIWDKEKEKSVDYEFEDSFVEVMKKGVDALDKAETIHHTQFAICKKIREL